MNAGVKTFIATAAHRSGLLNLLKRGVSGNVVLALHRVLPRAEIGAVYEPKVAVTSESFDTLLQFLSDNHHIVAAREFLQQCKSRNDLATITFDDGWVDNYQHAFPLLQKYRLPATIFLPTGLINTNFRLPEQRVVDLWKAVEASGRAEQLVAGIKADSGLTIQSVREAQSGFKRIPYDKKIEILDRQERVFGISGSGRSFLSWDEVREMHRAGITFGSHTQNHTVLTEENDELVWKELQSSSADLFREIGEAPLYFAYPNGRYDDRVAAICRRFGYEAAFTTRNTFVARNSDFHRLPRVAIDDDVISGPDGNFNVARADFYFTRAARDAS